LLAGRSEQWAPYTNTKQDGIPTFTKGIWKSVSIVEVGSAAITDVVPQITYAGAYPTAPLDDDTHGGFNVSVRVHTWAAKATSGTLHVTGGWAGASLSKQVTIAAGNTSTVLALPTAKDVKLWWPNGHGAQPLYNLSVSFVPSGATTAAITGSAQAGAVAAAPISTHRRVGFRFFALVTGNDTDPAYVAASKGQDGTEKLGMLWRINGAAIFSKGANMIPMEELEGRMSAVAHRQLVQSAVDGGMNTLRVWGGGMFLPREWYEACDELGIMVYHDMQYAQGGHSPKNNAVQDAELRHQIRRLASHASIVMWDGCNECRVLMGKATGIYATFVMTVVAEEDQSRAIWPSCPALGWTGGVDRLTSIPNGKPLVRKGGTSCCPAVLCEPPSLSACVDR
jgi:beta-mannosidase